MFRKTSIIFSVAFISITTVYGLPIKNFLLDSARPYLIKTAEAGKGVTTVMFPSPITSIEGANVTGKHGEKGGYVLTYNKGSYFFSVQAQEMGPQKAKLNIVYNHATYVICLETAKDDNEYFASVNFQTLKQISGFSGKKTSPPVVLDLIEKAKLYPILINQYPEDVQDITYVKKDHIFRYNQYNIMLKNVYRYDHADTVVFQLLIKNETGETLVYDPNLLSARLGSQIYFASVADASGMIPPHAEVPAWFAVTGTPTGRRNEMAADNNWIILLSASKINATKTTLNIHDKILSKEVELQKQLNEISKRLNTAELLPESEAAMLQKKLSILLKEIETLKNTRNYTK